MHTFEFFNEKSLEYLVISSLKFELFSIEVFLLTFEQSDFYKIKKNIFDINKLPTLDLILIIFKISSVYC